MRLAVLFALLPRLALAQPSATPPAPPPSPAAGDAGADYQPPPDTRHDTILHVSDERSTQNIAMLSAIAGLGAVAGGIGLYYHLDSKSASDEVSAHRVTGKTWSPELQATYDRAHDSTVKAGVFYGIGGAFVIGAIVAMIVTEPKEETVVIHPRGPTLAPTPGGAVLGGIWSF